MSEFDDLVRSVENRLRRDLDVDAGLGSLLGLTHGNRTPRDLAEDSSRFLRRRVRALEAATDRLKVLDAQLHELASLLPVLPGEWAAQRQLLRRSLEDDPVAGLALWLSNWWTAVGLARFDAMERLVSELELLPALTVLGNRAEVVRRGLEGGSWSVVARCLEPTMEGVTVTGDRLPDDTGRARLAALIARLWALHEESSDRTADTEQAVDLTPYLERVADLGLPATAAGLGSRWLRMRGDDAEAQAWLARCDGEDAADLDVTAELIERARRSGEVASAQETAAAAVAAVALIGEVPHRLTALLYTPPYELWVATAQRALEEEDFEVLDRAVARVLDGGLVQSDGRIDFAARARIAELRAAAAELQDRPVEDLVTALVDAGSNWLWSNAAEQATPHLERARRLDPEQLHAELLLADSLLASAGSLPLSGARARLHRAIDLVNDARERKGIDGTHAWAFAVEAYARTELLKDLTPTADEHGWPALLAACRGLAYDLHDASRWTVLADTLQAMQADDLALDVAAHVVRSISDGPGERQVHARTLANAGFPEKALLALEPLVDGQEGDHQDHDYTEAVRAYCVLRLRDPLEAARILRAVPPRPDWTWATECLIDSLVLTGRISEVAAEVAALERRCGDRLDEWGAVVSMARIRLLQGRFEDAEQLCRSIPERHDEREMLLGSALLLQGRTREGLDQLEAWMRGSAERWGLVEWSVVESARLRVRGVQYGVDVPPLADLQALADERLSELRWAPYPAEGRIVGRFSAPPSDPIADLAVGFSDALIHIARGAVADASGSLATLADEDEIAHLLQRSLETTPRSVSDVAGDAPSSVETGGEVGMDDGQESAERIVWLIRQHRLEEAREQLRELLSGDPDDLARNLWYAAYEGGEAYDALGDALDVLADGSGTATAATVRDLLRRWVPVGLTLPPSWFVGHEDPVATHSIFTRYLPEAKVRTADMPGVRVTTDEALEPAGYAVLLGAREVERNVLPADRRFAPAGSERLLGAEASSSCEEVLPGVVAFPDHRPNDLGQLVSLSAEELVVRRTEVVFREWLQRLDDKGSPSEHRDHARVR